MTTIHALTPERQALILHSTLVARAVAEVRRIFPRASADLLGSAGELAIVLAAASYDFTRGVPFDGYAWTRVRFAVLKAAIEELGLGDEVLAAVRGMFDALDRQKDRGNPFDDTPAEMRAQAVELCGRVLAGALVSSRTHALARDPEQAVGEAQERARATRIVHEILSEMPEAERRVLQLRYFEERDFGAISDLLHMSYSTVRRCHELASERLEKRLRARGIDRAPPPDGS